MPSPIKMIRAKHATTPLEREVLMWLNENGQDYPEDGAEGAYRDLMHGGCTSGIVGDLIYTVDCLAFFKKYRKDISDLLSDMLQDTGEGIEKLFKDWDSVDPLAREPHNQNILAWFGFEEAARIIASRAGIED